MDAALRDAGIEKDEKLEARRKFEARPKKWTSLSRRYRHVVDIDLSKFFRRIQHDVFMARVSRRVDDKLLLRLMGRYLRTGVVVDRVLQPAEVGTPQGRSLSPSLSSILLDDLNEDLERRGLPFARYAHDFAVSC